MTVQNLELQYQNFQERIDNVFDFLRDFQHFRQNIQSSFNANALLNGVSTKQKLRLLFIDAIKAAGGSNLSRNGPTCQLFSERISTLPDGTNVPLQSFYDCIDPTINSFPSLFNYLSNGLTFRNFREKKAALFLNKVHWLQDVEMESKKLFSGFDVSKMELVIPVDSVITFILNKVFNFTGANRLNQYGDFVVINDFFKSMLGDEFMIVEDFWFWGYFATFGNAANRIIQFNIDKYHTADFIVPTRELQEAILEFIERLE